MHVYCNLISAWMATFPPPWHCLLTLMLHCHVQGYFLFYLFITCTIQVSHMTDDLSPSQVCKDYLLTFLMKWGWYYTRKVLQTVHLLYEVVLWTVQLLQTAAQSLARYISQAYWVACSPRLDFFVLYSTSQYKYPPHSPLSEPVHSILEDLCLRGYYSSSEAQKLLIVTCTQNQNPSEEP